MGPSRPRANATRRVGICQSEQNQSFLRLPEGSCFVVVPLNVIDHTRSLYSTLPPARQLPNKEMLERNERRIATWFLDATIQGR